MGLMNKYYFLPTLVLGIVWVDRAQASQPKSPYKMTYRSFNELGADGSPVSFSELGILEKNVNTGGVSGRSPGKLYTANIRNYQQSFERKVALDIDSARGEVRMKVHTQPEDQAVLTYVSKNPKFLALKSEVPRLEAQSRKLNVIIPEIDGILAQMHRGLPYEFESFVNAKPAELAETLKPFQTITAAEKTKLTELIASYHQLVGSSDKLEGIDGKLEALANQGPFELTKVDEPKLDCVVKFSDPYLVRALANYPTDKLQFRISAKDLTPNGNSIIHVGYDSLAGNTPCDNSMKLEVQMGDKLYSLDEFAHREWHYDSKRGRLKPVDKVMADFESDRAVDGAGHAATEE
jgi:hypothetical protein